MKTLRLIFGGLTLWLANLPCLADFNLVEDFAGGDFDRDFLSEVSGLETRQTWVILHVD